MGKVRKKLQKAGKKRVTRVKGHDIEVWMLILVLLAGYFVIGPSYTVIGNSYEGPQMEFVGVEFTNQKGRDSGRTVNMDGLYSQNRKTSYYSKWDWRDPSHVHIDPDEAKAGIPDLYLIDDGFGQVNVKLEDSSKPIDTISYKVLHNGKEWEVHTFLYYYKAYVTVEVKGDEDLLNALYDEVDWNVKADIWMKVGMNRWNIQNYDEEMWGGLLKLEVREALHDTDAQSRSEFSPNARAQLSLFTDINGGHLGQLEFDDFSSGWKNPDRIPDRGYFKTSIDFTVGKAHFQSGVLKHPWCEWTVVCHVLVTHRFVSPQQQLGEYFPPVMNDERTWYTDLLGLIDKLTLGVDVLESLLILAIIGFAVIIVALIVLPNIFRRR